VREPIETTTSRSFRFLLSRRNGDEVLDRFRGKPLAEVSVDVVGTSEEGSRRKLLFAKATGELEDGSQALDRSGL
jgi:hypothetical protein